MFTLDTNAIIYYLQSESGAVSKLRPILSKNTSIYTSAVTELELFSFANLTEADADQIDNILKTLVIIPLDSRLARIAGTIRRVHKLKSLDSVVAATALLTGSVLITRNVRDFRKIEKLSILEI